jgi:serine/threonine protein kinase
MHSNNVIHRDLKPENVLINSKLDLTWPLYYFGSRGKTNKKRTKNEQKTKKLFFGEKQTKTRFSLPYLAKLTKNKKSVKTEQKMVKTN